MPHNDLLAESLRFLVVLTRLKPSQKGFSSDLGIKFGVNSEYHMILRLLIFTHYQRVSDKHAAFTYVVL